MASVNLLEYSTSTVQVVCLLSKPYSYIVPVRTEYVTQYPGGFFAGFQKTVVADLGKYKIRHILTKNTNITGSDGIGPQRSK